MRDSVGGRYRSQRRLREIARRLRAGLVLCAALPAAGCSIALPIASLATDDPATTGSVRAKPASPLSAELGTEDWRRARGALAIALDPQGNGSSVSWDNPETGLKGTFVPAGKPFVKNDEVCRAFLATVLGQATPLSLQGTACRPSGGEWTIRSVAPRTRPAAG